MSYILEALRRAERERQASKIPSVESLAQAPVVSSSGVPLRIWLLGGTTVAIAAAALIVSLWPRPAPPEAAPAAAPPEVAAAPMPAPARPAPRIAPTGLEDDGELQTLDDVASHDSDDEAPIASAPLQPHDISAPPPASAPVQGMSSAAPPPAPTSTSAGTTASAAPTFAAPGGITPLREMPDSYRAQFPVRTLDVHVYDPDPARRWIMVNGRRYGEGQTLDSGPRISQITDNGVVFEFQNALVLLPVR